MATIMVIDDDPNILAVLTRILEKGGHTVTVAQDGKAALRRFVGRPTDLVITDVYMPEMGGLEFLMLVGETFPEARIISMSGGGHLPGEDVLAAARNLGAVGVLRKPFEPREVLELVDSVLSDEASSAD